ncbi:MAG: hypothetical protein ORN57_04200, partial [Alphaproteobacteria bacterium]|nr:hypothetical protein [Alphaproteobacteria bacterium]
TAAATITPAATKLPPPIGLIAGLFCLILIKVMTLGEKQIANIMLATIITNFITRACLPYILSDNIYNSWLINDDRTVITCAAAFTSATKIRTTQAGYRCWLI